MAQRKDDLLDWYLAYLRKNALNRKPSQDLTPMTLVDSDKEMLQQIVEESAQPDEAALHTSTLQRNSWLIQLVLAVVITGSLLIALLVGN